MLIGACGYGDSGDVTGPGRVSLILGHPNPDGVKTLSTDADAHYVGMAPGEQGCVTQAGAGDINGDGLSDLVIGSPGWGEGLVGRAYVVFADGTSSPAARYRVINLTGRGTSQEVGQSGVTLQGYSPFGTRPGSVYVTRHFVDTCATRFATNGLLWSVERYEAHSDSLYLTFTYNGYQISGGLSPRSSCGTATGPARSGLRTRARSWTPTTTGSAAAPRRGPIANIPSPPNPSTSTCR